MLLVMIGIIIVIGSCAATDKKPDAGTPNNEPRTTKDEAKIEELIKQLGDEDWKIREEATKELIEIGKPAVFPLIDALDAEDPEIRSRAENILSQLEPEFSKDEVIVFEGRLKQAKGKIKDILEELCKKWWIGIEGGTPVNGLQLTIRSDKKEYNLREQITIMFRLRNVGREDIYICKNFEWAPYSYEITGPKGPIKAETLSWEPKESVPPLTKDAFTLLKPNKSYIVKTVGEYGEGINDEGIIFSAQVGTCTRSSWILSKTGKYQIKIVYGNSPHISAENDGKKFGLKAWTGEVVSNTITIEIKEGKN
jgi:hypothetical protein